jgi:hypothetical protein
MFYMSIAIQGAIVAYMVCSFFSSIQYQWYVYYVAAYAVALRKIHAAEEVEGAVNIVPAEGTADVGQHVGQAGVLWSSARVRKGILANPAEGR